VRELGCDLAQGYLIAPPLEPEALGPWEMAFRSEWSELVADRSGDSGTDVEANALSER
jgi:hypothetical protein